MKITILGAGAYGLALAHIINKNNHDITIWTKFTKEQEELETKRTNKNKLSNYKLPKNIKITTNLEESIKNKDLILIAIPTNALEETIKNIKNINKKTHICLATKGIQQKTNKLPDNILKKYIHNKKYGIISGGSFTVDIINDSPIGLTLATKNKETEKIIIKALQTNNTKIRTTKDIKGTEICGSIKNILAIASGILHGMNMPESTIAMFLTEALNDIQELIYQLNGNKKTILSYAGFADIYLTCTSNKSRNFKLGKMIGQNKSKEEINNYIENTTIEGLYTLKSIYDLTKNKKIKIPIINMIYNIIYKNKDPKELINFLITKK